MDRLTYIDCTEKHTRSRDCVYQGTNSGDWFLKRKEFQRWANEPRSGLLCAYGKRKFLDLWSYWPCGNWWSNLLAGAGKTILTWVSVLSSSTTLTSNPGPHHRSIVIDALKRQHVDATVTSIRTQTSVTLEIFCPPSFPTLFVHLDRISLHLWSRK